MNKMLGTKLLQCYMIALPPLKMNNKIVVEINEMKI